MKTALRQRTAAVVASALLLTGCGVFRAKEIGLDKRTPSEALEYYNIAIGNIDELSFETRNFLFGNLPLADVQHDPGELVRRVAAMHEKEPQRLSLAALNDLCFHLALRTDDPEQAIPYFLTALHSSYQLLFDERYGARDLGKFDPSLYQAMRIYNSALAHLAAFLTGKGLLHSAAFQLNMADGGKVLFRPPLYRLPFPEKTYKDFLPCSDFRIKNLVHFSHESGLGVPLVAVTGEDAACRPLRTAAPIAHGATLFLRFEPPDEDGAVPVRLEFYDNDQVRTITVGAEKQVPLIFDYSTPLAYYIGTMPDVDLLDYMLHPADDAVAPGLYTLEPYSPQKIPVVLIHGLMSSIHTWMQMVNTLKNDPVIREHYQFWFYTYSSGNPILHSAALFRKSLKDAREKLAVTPEAQAAFDRMVLVGHSMGGLVGKTAVQDAGESMLRDLIGLSWDEVRSKCTPEQQQKIHDLVMYERVPSVRRVLFLAVPHRGSEMAKYSIARFGSRLIELPGNMVAEAAAVIRTLFAGNSAGERAVASLQTGIDGLDPDNRMLQALDRLPLAPDVPCHSIIGNREAPDKLGGTDGVVPYASAHLDSARSELIVRSDHSVQKHPATIREVRRILRLHLEENRIR